MITESKAKTARQINIKTQLHMLQITTTTPSVGNIETNNYMTDTTSHRWHQFKYTYDITDAGLHQRGLQKFDYVHSW